MKEKHMEVKVAKTAGFCFGVDRAVKIAEKLAKEGKKVRTLGPIIHNKSVVKELEEIGVFSVDTVEAAESDSTLVIRSHGVSKEVYNLINENKI